MDASLQDPLRKLSRALSQAIAASPEVDDALRRVREAGYDAHVALEVSIAVSRAVDRDSALEADITACLIDGEHEVEADPDHEADDGQALGTGDDPDVAADVDHDVAADVDHDVAAEVDEDGEADPDHDVAADSDHAALAPLAADLPVETPPVGEALADAPAVSHPRTGASPGPQAPEAEAALPSEEDAAATWTRGIGPADREYLRSLRIRLDE